MKVTEQLTICMWFGVFLTWIPTMLNIPFSRCTALLLVIGAAITFFSIGLDQGLKIGGYNEYD